MGSGTEWNDLHNPWQAEVKRLQARIAVLEAERERVKMLAEAWKNAGTGLRDYHDCARQLLAAMNSEEGKQP